MTAATTIYFATTPGSIVTLMIKGKETRVSRSGSQARDAAGEFMFRKSGRLSEEHGTALRDVLGTAAYRHKSNETDLIIGGEALISVMRSGIRANGKLTPVVDAALGAMATLLKTEETRAVATGGATPGGATPGGKL